MQLHRYFFSINNHNQVNKVSLKPDLIRLQLLDKLFLRSWNCFPEQFIVYTNSVDIGLG